MSKNITIQEGGASKTFADTDKLETSLVGGSIAVLWNQSLHSQFNSGLINNLVVSVQLAAN